jgi:flagellar basal-body rod modification protein FlgD
MTVTGPIPAVSGGPSSSPPGRPDASLASPEVFLQLLVAQLKNQNPLDPSDGTEFITQLAGFTQLERTIGIHDELKGIREVLSAWPAPPAATSQPGEE